MRFGKIEYLNLLTFDVFIKQCSIPSNLKAMFRYKKSYPSKLNYEFLFRRIDAGFLSSIMYAKHRNIMYPYETGIIAHKKVWSVLVRHIQEEKDYQSATSNALSQVLDLQGSVIIGDKALEYFYQKCHYGQYKDENFSDMATVWYEKTNLPFVFGRVCCNGYRDFYSNLMKAFHKKLGKNNKNTNVRIPHYILMPYVHKLNIDKKFANEYLECIYYIIGAKEKSALRRFYRTLRLKQINPPKRF